METPLVLLNSRARTILGLAVVAFFCWGARAGAAPAMPPGPASCDSSVAFRNRVLPEMPDSDDDNTPQGTVTVIADVSENGTLSSPIIAVSSHNGIIDRAALTAAQKSTFAPATYHCKPVPSDIVLRYVVGDSTSVTLTAPLPQEENLEVAARPHASAAPTAKPKSPTHPSTSATLSACVQTIGQNHIAGLAGAVRVASCMLGRQKPTAAGEIIKKALTPHAMPTNAVAATHPEWTLAYLRLAQAQSLSGQRADARKNAETALRLNRKLNASVRVAEVPREAARILATPHG